MRENLRLLSLILLALMPLGIARAAADVCDAAHDRTCAEKAFQRGDYTPAAEAATAFLAEHADDFDMRWLRAQAFLRGGEAGRAAPDLEKLVVAAPNDADVHYAFGLALLNTSEPARAADEFDTARRLAPENEDAWRLEVAALEKVEGREAEQRRTQLLEEARARFPQARWHVAAEPATAAPMLTAAGEYSNLSGDNDAWSEVALGIVDGRHRVRWAAGLRSVERFKLRDTEVSGSLEWPASPQWTFGAEAAWAPDAEVLARNMAGANVAMHLGKQSILSLGLRHLSYDGPEVTMGVLGAEYYWPVWQAAWRLYASDLDGSTGVSQVLQVTRYFDANHLSLSAGYGDEIESLGQGRVLRVKSTVVALGGVLALNERYDLTADASWQDLETLYERWSLRLGIRRRW